MAKLIIVVAVARNNAIGRGNTLPWRCPEDMALFKEITTGKTVLMGRNTALSIGRALPHRNNLVLTSGEAPYPGQTVVRSLSEALSLDRGNTDIYVIGGEQLYRLALPFADEVYISILKIDVEGADAFFPEMDVDDWVTKSMDRFDESSIPFIHARLERSIIRA